MTSILVKGVIRNGRVEVVEPIDLPDGSEVTIAGSAVNLSRVETWSEAKNKRRCDLIRKKFSQGISAEESSELADLQCELSAYRKQTTPLPYDVVDELQAIVHPPMSAPPL